VKLINILKEILTEKAKSERLKTDQKVSGVPQHQWAMGIANSFITGKGGARKADADLYKKSKKK